MPIKVACACGKKLAVKDELAGKKIKCPTCQKLLSIPMPKVQAESLEDVWDLGDSAEEDFEDELSNAPVKSRGGKSSASREAVLRKSSGKDKGKKSKSSNRGLLIGLSAGGGVLVIVLLAWLLWPTAPADDVAGRPNDKASATPEAANDPHASFSQFTDGMSETLLAGMVSESHSIPWTMPGDILMDATFPSKENTFVDGATMFADGSVRHMRFRDGINRDSLHAMFTISGQEPSPMSKLYPPNVNLTDPTYATPQEHVRHSEARSANKNSLKAIAVAFHKYHDAKRHLPPATVFGPDGKPWHSWRVLILPFLGHQTLHDEYDQTVPWNDPKNAAVLEKMPPEYRDPLSNNPSSNQTIYLVVTGRGTGFPTGNAAKDAPRPALSPTAQTNSTAASAKSSPAIDADEITGDLKALQGVWQLMEVETGAATPPSAAQLDQFKATSITITGDTMTIVEPSGKAVSSIKLDSTQKPKTIDLTVLEGPNKGAMPLGIYSLDGDTLRMCLARPGALQRPAELKPDAALAQRVMVLKRAGAANAQAAADKFDHKAWERVQPTKRGFGPFTKCSAFAITRRELCQLFLVRHSKSWSTRDAWPVCSKSTFASCNCLPMTFNKRWFFANPNRYETSLASHHLFERSRRRVDVRQTQLRAQRKHPAEDVQRQEAVLVVVPVKESPRLMPVHRIVGRVEVRFDHLRRRRMRGDEGVDEEVLHVARPRHDLLVPTRRIRPDRRQLQPI